MVREFFDCPFCGFHFDRGFTSVEFHYDHSEVWLSHGTFVEHKHKINLPAPDRLNIGENGGRLTILERGE